MSTVFYDKFERHAHGEGLKARSTHYCPGCGHGLAHKYLAQAIESLGIQDRTIAVSPVGCAVFLYYYMDVGNTQAAHGRAPAVAVAHKVSNPDAIVVSYQGDGDLASIGLAGILSTAQTGVPISVVFVNNAIYGMTGGQMAPTTLLGQKATTCVDGRTAKQAGYPIKMSEMLATIDGATYIERTTVHTNPGVIKTKAAIKKAFQTQVDGKGFSMVEILSMCPTNWGTRLDNPSEATKFVAEGMLPVFPLGVYKDACAADKK